MAKKSYREKQIELHLMHWADLFEGDPGGGLFNGKPRAFVLQETEKNIWKPVREEVLLYFNGKLSGEDKIAFWGASGKKTVAGHSYCNLPTGHVLSSQIACINHLFPVCHDEEAATVLLRGLYPNVVAALPVDIHSRGLFVEFEVTGGGSYLNEEKGEGTISRGSNATSIDAVMKGRDIQGNIRLFLIEWKYTEEYRNASSRLDERDDRLWRYRSFFTRDDSPFTFCNSNSDRIFFSELLTEPYYQLMRQTLLGWKMTRNPQDNGQATQYSHIMVIPHGNDALRMGCQSIAQRRGSLADNWNALVREDVLFSSPEDVLRPLHTFPRYSALRDYLSVRYWGQ